MQNYLGVASAVDDENQNLADGRGSIFGDLGPFSLSYPFNNYSDVVNPNASAELAFAGDVGNLAVNKETADYRTTYWGFPWEAIPTPGDREQALSTFIAWCSIGFNPTILVSPSVVDRVVLQNQTITDSLTIENAGSADLQWSIEEAASGDCSAVEDIPWLSLAPSEGNIQAGAAAGVDITMNAVGIEAGNYGGKLCVSSNDLSTPLREVQVDMLVVAYMSALPLSALETSWN